MSPWEDLETEARALDTDPATWRSWLEILGEFGARFLEANATAKAYESAYPPPAREEIPRAPESFERVLEIFGRRFLPGGIRPTSGRFFAYVPGGGIPTAAVGDLVAALTNLYAGVYEAGPGAVAIENQVVQWLCEMVGYGPKAFGTLQSGGSLATVTAAVAARESWPVSRWKKGVIYLSVECHNCVEKAIKVVGLHHHPLRRLPVRDDFTLDPATLERAIKRDKRRGLKPWMLFCSAGTINTGAVDPLNDLADICERENVWLHVDGAYGGLFVLSPSARERLAGMARADSLVIDPHKALFQPYGCGAVLLKDGKLLQKAFGFKADYLADVDHVSVASPTGFSPELTRHFRALRLWWSLKVHGIARFEAAIEEKWRLAQWAHAKLGEIASLQMGPAPQLSTVTFRVKGPDTRTEALLENIQREGTFLLSSTRLGGKLYLRMCILSFRSHHKEVTFAIDRIRRYAIPLR